MTSHDQPTPIHKPNFDWIAGPAQKAQIEQAWNEYEQDPTEWRYSRYDALTNKVFVEQNPGTKLTYRTFEDVPRLSDQ